MGDFTLTKLAGTGVVVTGTDNRGYWGEEVLDSTQWEEVKRHSNYVTALDAVDAAIATLLAPVNEAIDAAQEKLALPAPDPLFTIIERAGVEHVPGQAEIVTQLNRDSVILRAIHENQTDRLIWVGGELTVTAEPVPVAATPPTQVDTDGDGVPDLTVQGDEPTE